jgi:flagellin
MAFATGGNARIRTNISAQNAYNQLEIANRAISTNQLRLSTGLRINNASDDVAGYITSRSLEARNGILKAAMKTVGEALNVTNIGMDALDNIQDLVIMIREQTATASSGALGTSEKVALAKAAFRMVEQIQTVADSTVFGGRQILDGEYKANFYVGSNALNDLLTITVDLQNSNEDFNVESNDFNINTMRIDNFAGVTNLNLRDLNEVNASDLGIFDDSVIGTTLGSLADAIDNITKTASYMGGISNRLTSQQDILQGSVVNYNAAISRIEDADVALEQMNLIKNQFLQQTSLTSLAQSNQNPNAFLQLLQG